MGEGGWRGWPWVEGGVGALSVASSVEKPVSGLEWGRAPGPAQTGAAPAATVSASFQVVKPTSAPPMPPVKPGPTGVSPSVPWQCPPQAFR